MNIILKKCLVNQFMNKFVNLLKISVFVITLILIFVAYSTLPPGNRTGSPGDGGATCAGVGCHQYGPFTSQVSFISSTIPPSGYMPGDTYTITIFANFPGHTRYGFEISPQDINGNLIGQVIITNTTTTQLHPNGRDVVHTLQGTYAQGGSAIYWSFKWIAPTTLLDSTTFYLTLNVSNNNGNPSGDSIYISSATFYKNPITSAEPIEYNNLRYFLNHNPQYVIDLTGRRYSSIYESQFPTVYIYWQDNKLIKKIVYR